MILRRLAQRAALRVRDRHPRLAAALRWIRRKRHPLTSAIVVIAHTAGALTSVRAVMETRTSQGAIAWAVSLNTFPYVAVPAYWIFGRDRFQGYVIARRQALLETNETATRLMEQLRSEHLGVTDESGRGRVVERLAKLPVTGRNHAELLIDGKATFDAIFESIDQARDYVLVQFYIIRDDELGRELHRRLAERAAAGVRVLVLYDEIGSAGLPDTYVEGLRRDGIAVSRFHSTKGTSNRFQLNFRNHRKIVVVDGRSAFVGGHNVGVEYLGQDPELSPWRDTHVKVAGPVVQCIQVPFAEDWYWATGEVLDDLEWDPEPAPQGDMAAFCLPSGPADTFESCALFFLHAINEARSRIWIASPYFVPDEQIVSALQLAALRGVDVRILIPETPDSTLVYLSSFSYLEPAERAGVRIFRHQPGFMHQKVMLVDDDVACVGTANFDNRSFRLNFEITVGVQDATFAREVETMLLADFAASRPASTDDLEKRSFPFRLAVRVARLLAPIQ